MNLHEVNEAMSELDGWNVEGNAIVKSTTLQNFNEAMEFANKIGEIAERFDHHPYILIKYNIVKLILMTHKVGGLTKTDFEVAKEIDKL